MWIVSQDGNSLINADNACSIARVDSLIAAYGEYSNTIGEYSSPEKAAAVMKHIIATQQGFYTLSGRFPDGMSANDSILDTKSKVMIITDDARLDLIGETVFQMPQDEDVMV